MILPSTLRGLASSLRVSTTLGFSRVAPSNFTINRSRSGSNLTLFSVSERAKPFGMNLSMFALSHLA